MMNAEQIALALGGKRSGRQWACRCPAHEDRSPSLIVFDGRESVQVRCLAGCDPRDVIGALRRGGLWPAKPRELYYQMNSPDRETPGIELVDHTEYARRMNPDNQPLLAPMSDLALRIWKEGKDAHGTMAERYLHARDLVLPPLHASEIVRYHPRCPRGKGRQPALMALFRDGQTDRPKAIQRIFLTSDARKDGAQMLGPVGGCAMKLSSKADTFTDALGFCPVLNICEGLETGLALYAASHKPIWAVGSAGAIQNFTVLFGVGELVIWADNDGAGIYAAESCLARWNAKNRHVTINTPEDEGCDFADFLNG